MGAKRKLPTVPVNLNKMIGEPQLFNSAQKIIVPRGQGNSVPNIIVYTPKPNAGTFARNYEWIIGIQATYNPAITIGLLGKKNGSGLVDHWIQQASGGAVLNSSDLIPSINGMQIYTIKPSAASWLKDYEWVVGAPINSTTVLAIFGSHRNHKFQDWTKRKDNGVRIAGNTLYGFVPAV